MARSGFKVSMLKRSPGGTDGATPSGAGALPASGDAEKPAANEAAADSGSTSSSSSQSSADSKNDNAAQEVTSAAPPLAATSEEEPAEAEAPTGKEESTNSSPLHSAVPPAASTPVERRSESPTPAEMTIPEENESTGTQPLMEKEAPEEKNPPEEEPAKDTSKKEPAPEEPTSDAAEEEAAEEIAEKTKAREGADEAKQNSPAKKGKKRQRAEKEKTVTAGEGSKTDEDGKNKSGEDGKGKVAGKKAGRTPYAIFCDEKRAAVKEAQPDLKAAEVNKVLSGQWKELDSAQKKHYKGLSDAEKNGTVYLTGSEAATAPAAAGSAPAPEARSTPATPPPADPETYEAYCAKHFQRVQAGLGSGANFQDIGEQLRKEWQAAGHGSPKSPAPPASAAPSAKGRGGAKRKGRAAKKNEGDKPTKKPKAQDGPEKARERSWDKALDAVCATLDKSTIEKTIECVLAKSEDGQYLVKRVGENYTQTEWMDFPIDSKGVCHDPALALAIQAFRSGEEAFHKDLDERKCTNGELDLDDLEEGSSLEVLAFLGRVREDAFPAAGTKLPKDDVWMKVPMLATCQLFQRMLDTERRAAKRQAGAVRTGDASPLEE